MPYHVGQVQTGLPSREATYVAPLVGESQWQTGISQTGGISMPVGTVVYICKSSLRGFHRIRHKCISLLTKPYKLAYRIEGYDYTSNFRHYFECIGGMGVTGKNRIKIISELVLSSKKIHKVIGLSGKKYAKLYRAISVLHANYSNKFKLTSVLQVPYNRKLPINATLVANFAKKLSIKGLLHANFSNRYKVIGLKGWGVKAIHKVTSSLKRQLIKPIRVEGDLANTLGHWYLRITGKINIAAFVQAVPKRIQEFVTNKVWFK